MCTGKSIGQAPFLHQHPPLKDSAHSMYSAVNSKATWLLINLASNWSKYRYYISYFLVMHPTIQVVTNVAVAVRVILRSRL